MNNQFIWIANFDLFYWMVISSIEFFLALFSLYMIHVTWMISYHTEATRNGQWEKLTDLTIEIEPIQMFLLVKYVSSLVYFLQYFIISVRKTNEFMIVIESELIENVPWMEKEDICMNLISFFFLTTKWNTW